MTHTRDVLHCLAKSPSISCRIALLYIRTRRKHHEEESEKSKAALVLPPSGTLRSSIRPRLDWDDD